MALEMGNWGYNPYKWGYNPTYNWMFAHLAPLFYASRSVAFNKYLHMRMARSQDFTSETSWRKKRVVTHQPFSAPEMG